MDAADQNEPLFSLSRIEEDPLLDFEARAEAFGYGMALLRQVMDNDEDLHFYSHWIVGKALHLLKASKKSSSAPLSRLRKELNERRILRAGRFLFALENINQRLVETAIESPLPNSKELVGNSFRFKCAVVKVWLQVG